MTQFGLCSSLRLPLAAAALFGLVSAAVAEDQALPEVHVIKSVAGVGETQHDWLAKPNKSTELVVYTAQRVALGNGSWICSPSGFGRKSTCFKR